MGASSAVEARSPAAVPRCRLCTCRLEPTTDNIAMLVCIDCSKRPEAQHLGPPPAANGTSSARGFTPADRSLIKQVHSFMPTQKLLELLNERLLADLGPDARRYTIEQLHAELRTASATNSDWAGLRKLLAQARQSGALDLITAQTIEDFAVVFSLTPAQAMRLKDVILSSRGGQS